MFDPPKAMSGYGGPQMGVRWDMYRVEIHSKNGSVVQRVPDLQQAAVLAKIMGVQASYCCSDGRVFLYASQEDCDAGENGLEIGVIEGVAE